MQHNVEKSFVSSIARKREMTALQLKQTELSLELEREQAEAERSRADAEFRRRKLEVELEQAQAVAQMELLKLKEATSLSGGSKSKRKEQLQRREVVANNSAGMGVGRIFFRGSSRGFYQHFFQGGEKVVKFGFYPSKLKKQPFLPIISKSRGSLGPHAPPSDAHERR